MILYHWVPNILCAVKEGKAYATTRYRNKLKCSGECHTCDTFMGVDPTDIGRVYFKSCCRELMGLKQTVDVANVAIGIEDEAV